MRMRKNVVLGLLAVLVVLGMIVAGFGTAVSDTKSSNIKGAKATGWWNVDWQYRKAITITENSGTSLIDYQVSVDVDTASLISQGKMRNDGGDIRFTDSSGIEIPYWVESFDNLSYDEPTDYVANWSMDEGAGSTIYDNSTNNNDGTIYGASWTSGKYGNALSFDGVDDYVKVPHSDSLNPTKAITVSCWVKMLETVDIHHELVVKNPDTSPPTADHPQYSLGITGKMNASFWIKEGTTSAEAVGATAIAKDEWHYFVGTFDDDADEIRVYLDGELDGSASTTISMALSTVDVYMAYGYNKRYVNAVIDEVRIYNRSLSADEIKSIYEEKSKIWVKVPSISASGQATIYMYYGNPSATSESNFTNVFPFEYVRTLTSAENARGARFAPTQEKRNLIFLSLDNDIYAERENPIYNVETGVKVGGVNSYRGKQGFWSGSATYVAVGQGGNSARNRVYRTSDWEQVASVDGAGYDCYPTFQREDYLVSVYCYSAHERLKVWRISDWSVVRDSSGVGDWRMIFSQDWNRSAMRLDSDMRIWDTSGTPDTWSVIQTLTGAGGVPCWSLDGKRLLIAAVDLKKILIYSTSDWSLIKEIPTGGYCYRIADADFCFAATDYENERALIYTKDGTLVKEVSYTDHPCDVHFNVVNQYMAVSLENKTTYIYKVREYTSPEPTASIGAEEEKPLLGVPSVSLISPENNVWVNNRTIDFILIAGIIGVIVVIIVISIAVVVKKKKG